MNIEINNLTVAYEKHPAIHHVNLTIKKGDLLAIVGPNGAGKSTLLNALAGHPTVVKGSIKGLHPNEVAYLPQQKQIDQTFPITVSDLVAMGLHAKVSWYKSMCWSQQQKCKLAIAAVGLQGFEQRMINTLSGGQMQRALFARVLIEDKLIILLDEPFNAIDHKTINDLTEVIKSWHKDKRTVVMVLHDLDYVRTHCPKTFLLARQSIGFGKTQEVLTKNNIRLAKQMSEAFDESAYWCKR